MTKAPGNLLTRPTSTGPYRRQDRHAEVPAVTGAVLLRLYVYALLAVGVAWAVTVTYLTTRAGLRYTRKRRP